MIMDKTKGTFNAFEMTISTIQRLTYVLTILGVLLLLVDNGSRHDRNYEETAAAAGIFANAFSTTSINLQKSPTWERRRKHQETNGQAPLIQAGPVVVVGKIIIDEYRSPLEDNNDKMTTKETKITIGGGGPQAAWGAAAALLVMKEMEATPSQAWNETIHQSETTRDHHAAPPKQLVAFYGPVGNANGLVPDIKQGLAEILGPAVDSINLAVEPSLQTPTIQLWHDENQDIQWKPLNDCWGEKGADSLWRNRPSSEDILKLDCLQEEPPSDGKRETDGTTKAYPSSITEDDDGLEHKKKISNLHMIMEMGVSAAGGGKDCDFLLDKELMSRVSHVCIEPVAFPQEITMDDDGLNEIGSMAIPNQDVVSSRERLQQHSKIDLIVPDSHLVEAWIKSGYLLERCQDSEVVGRFGPSGSRVYQCATTTFSDSDSSSQSTSSSETVQLDYIQVPTATLETPSGKPINPTGAGNAYSGALSTCRSMGWSLEEAACLASAVGATFCEYEHLPPWTWNVLDRIQRGTLEVYDKMFVATK